MNSNLTIVFAFIGALSLGASACKRGVEQPNGPSTKNDWHSRTLEDCGIRIQLPPYYKEKHWDIKIGNPIGHTFRAARFHEIRVAVHESLNARLEDNKVIRQDEYENYAESTELIGGRQAIIQRYKGGGGIYVGNDKVGSIYQVRAIWQLKPNQVLSVAGSGPTQEAQDEALAIIHTVSFLAEYNAAPAGAAPSAAPDASLR